MDDEYEQQVDYKWGDDISDERKAKLEALYEQQRRWVESTAEPRDLDQSAFKNVRLNGTDALFLAALAVAGPGGNAAIAIRQLQLGIIEDRSALKDLHLERAHLSGAHLERAHLSGAHLEQAHLSGAHLEQADLRDAHLQGHLEGTDLREVHLQGADLSGAHLERTDLRKAHLERADLSGAYLQEAYLRDAHLQEAYLSDAHLQEANLSDAHLQEANLRDAHLQEANLRDAHLERADLSGVHLERADLSGAHLERADLSDAHLERADLRDAQLQGAILPKARLQKANLSGAELQKANLSGAELQGADLNRVTFDNQSGLAYAVLTDTPHWYSALWRRVFREPIYGPPSLADIHWNGADLTATDWSGLRRLGDERSEHWWWRSRDESERAVRASTQLAKRLRDAGMNDAADRFAYRAQVRQRGGHLLRGRVFRWLFSWLLFVVAGYGYRPLRTLFWYLATIASFAFAYYWTTRGVITFGLHPSEFQPLTWYEALVLSVSSFHGRGFLPFPNLGDPVTILAAIEAVFGLFIEVSFIATFTQRYFGK